MKCPRCGSIREYRYLVKGGYLKKPKDKSPRTDFRAKCTKCGYEGIEDSFLEGKIERTLLVG